MGKHTPGPWVVAVSDFLDQWVCIYAPSGDPDLDYKSWEGIAMAYGCGDSLGKGLEKAKANATLIASAPDLLEALEGLVRVNEQHNAAIQSVTGRPAGWKDDYLNQARAAIARARDEA